MGKVYEGISTELAAWIGSQPVFFVATAPLAANGHVNVSPKGLDCLRILDARRVAYLDLTGSGAETIAHVRENGRIVLMFCAFSGPPKIVRLHGRARLVTRRSTDWDRWLAHFPTMAAPRTVVVIDVTRVSDSCGYGVPMMEFKGHRDVLERWVERCGKENMPTYRRENNLRSIDGLAALDVDET